MYICMYQYQPCVDEPTQTQTRIIGRASDPFDNRHVKHKHLTQINDT